MKIAYIILAHKLPDQLVRLVNKLDTDSSFFFIHIDKKTDTDTYHRMIEPLKGKSNVYFIKRHIVNWGCFGHVQATLEGIHEALKLDWHFDYVVLMTGQDYPIKSNQYIHDFFEGSNKKSYLEYFPLPSEIWKEEDGGMNRINYWHLYTLGRPRKIIARSPSTRRKILGNLKLFGGRTNWCLSRECIEYVVNYLEGNKGFYKYCKHIGLPDEMFFQTILLNSHFQNRVINDNLKYVVWTPYSPNPKILISEDYDHFMSTKKLFARKFDVTVDANVLNMIDQATTH